MAGSLLLDVDGLNELLAESGRWPLALTTAVGDGLEAAGREFAGAFLERRLTGSGGRPQNPSPYTDRLQVRSGGLGRTFGSYLPEGALTLSDLRLRVGFGVMPGLPSPGWEWVHEFGATIVPKTGQYLSIPAPDNLTPAGLPRVKSVRDLGAPLFIHSASKPGTVLVFEAGVLMFVLVKSVHIPARLHFYQDVLRYVAEQMVARVQVDVDAWMDRPAGRAF